MHLCWSAWEKKKEKEKKSLVSSQNRGQIQKIYSTNITKHDCVPDIIILTLQKWKMSIDTKSKLYKVTYPVEDS